MELLRPSPEAAPYGLRAMTTIGRAATGGFGNVQRAMIDAAQKVIHQTDFDIDSLTLIDPQELSEHFPAGPLASQLVQGMVVMSLCDGPASPEQIRLIQDYARALDVDQPAIAVINKLTEHRSLLFRIDYYRQSHLREMFESQYRTQGGIVGLAKGVLGMRGLVADPELAKQFTALGDLPADTLGYEFYHHYRDHGFAFPGELGGFPVAAIFHDIMHVLCGYPTTPDGEIQVAAFHAGMHGKATAFFVLLFPIITFSTGFNITPVPQPQTKGVLGENDLAAKMLRAIERGSKLNTDLADDWDFWPFMPLPIDEVRNRLNVVPTA
jgi:hypothetical protein